MTERRIGSDMSPLTTTWELKWVIRPLFYLTVLQLFSAVKLCQYYRYLNIYFVLFLNEFILRSSVNY